MSKHCKLCKGELTEDDIIYINRYRCEYCGEEQDESETIKSKECKVKK